MDFDIHELLSNGQVPGQEKLLPAGLKTNGARLLRLVGMTQLRMGQCD